MGLMDEFQIGIGKATAASERVLQVARLKGQVADAQTAQQARYASLGQEVYAEFRRGDSLSPQLASLCQDCLAGESAIVALMRQLDAVQGTGSREVCVACGTAMPAGAAFCVSCGQPAQAAAEQTESRPCSNCGSPVALGAKFCGSCGAPGPSGP